MDAPLTALGLDEAFRFACGPEVACFNDCCRDLFQALTPYDALRLKRLRRPVCLRERVLTSGRRWEQRGVWRTIVLMWWLRLLYALGVSADRLAPWYR